MEYKGYIIKPHAHLPKSYVVATSGRGGKIPDVMSGMFTAPILIRQIIDTYLDNKEIKDTKNGQEISKS